MNPTTVTKTTTVLGVSFTRYRIVRDHGRRPGFFMVDVPEVRERGLGFQIALGPCVYGASITRRLGREP